MNRNIENRKSFLDRLQNRFSEQDITLIEFAYDIAKEAHRTQKRDRGGRYFEHPREGCLILMDELGIYDKELLIAFLFHDVGEDTPLLGNRSVSYDQFVTTATYRLTLLFGAEVADLVVRLTKPEVDFVRFFTKQQAFDYYVDNLAQKEKAMIGKAIDRLHNLRTIVGSGWKVQRIEKVIIETETVYLPLFESVQGLWKDSASKLLDKINGELANIKAST